LFLFKFKNFKLQTCSLFFVHWKMRDDKTQQTHTPMKGIQNSSKDARLSRVHVPRDIISLSALCDDVDLRPLH